MDVRLVTRGDDAASTRSANLAMAQCFEQGVLRNTSVMATGGELQHAADVFGPLQARGLCIGLHAAINSEWDWPRFRPLLPPEDVPSLVDEDGCFLRSPMHLHERGFNADEVMAELDAHLRALTTVGLHPVYLDEHMGVAWLDGLEDRFRAWAAEHGLIFARDAAEALPVPDEMSGSLADRWVKAVLTAPPGTYVLVTHPTFDDEETQRCYRSDSPPGQVAAERDVDRRSLVDPAFRQCIKDQDIRLVRYDEL